MKHLILAAAAALTLNIAQAVEVEGVKFDDKTTVGTSELVINGTGVRRKFGKRYVMALYLPVKTGDANAVLAEKSAKRVLIKLTKDVSGDTFANAVAGAMADNSTPAEMAAVKDRLKQWSDTIIALGEVVAGSTIQFDWIPEKGTQLSVNGQAKGKEIAGEDFYTALLRVWLGKDPVQDDIKNGLLGKAS
jgi:hypothetical protein